MHMFMYMHMGGQLRLLVGVLLLAAATAGVWGDVYAHVYPYVYVYVYVILRLSG